MVIAVTLCLTLGCSKDQESTSHAAADRAATPVVAFTPRSSLIVEEAAVHPSPTVAREQVEPTTENAPELSVSVDAEPTNGGAPLGVSFSAEVTGAPPGLQYRWDFGDRSAPAHQLNIQHTYGAAGEYTATFSATGAGVNESQQIEIEVTEEGFDIDINADPDIGTAPLMVEFSAVFDDDLPAPFSFQWDFGDGARDVTNPTRHTYRSPGQYTAALLVTNGLGQVARHDVEIQVDAPEPGE